MHLSVCHMELHFQPLCSLTHLSRCPLSDLVLLPPSYKTQNNASHNISNAYTTLGTLPTCANHVPMSQFVLLVVQQQARRLWSPS